MTEVTNDYLSSLGLRPYDPTPAKPKTGDRELGQEEFLNLMITQMTNQDPMSPMENTDFIAQMAQFSSLTGIQELTTAFETLSQSLLQGQALQAASLVGRDVLIPSETADLEEGEGINGAIMLDSSALDVTVSIKDSAGQLVRTLDLGTLSAGVQDFAWDGYTEDGELAPEGTYSFEIVGQVDGASNAYVPLLQGEVQSVFTDSVDGSLILNLKELGNVKFSDVFRIG
ncbi:flagellar hook assembly protein FlgD [Imhoffiella purpurea]|uniref:Basal-body rod modification protein FlgD n=1 Tax=Imhoffiella purpurea TaxID=1249627 RepID=W9W2W4_9GAMM|nr:flagellar hook assembly protein FlgD [Imhoffiella purpurea]EXJ16905.1 Flagellar basal-body rod modification protein FlgD [Imhoffiella purpurea]